MFGVISSDALRSKAAELVDAFQGRVAVRTKAAKRRAPEDLVQEALSQLFQSTAEYCRQQRLGILGRARLARALQQQLQQRGYAGDLVSKVTTAVTVNALIAPRHKA